MTLASLIERVEKAEAGSRELDAEIAAETRWPALGNIKHWVHDEEMEPRRHGRIGFKNLRDNPAEFETPHASTSLDAALALAERVLPGWVWGGSSADPLRGEPAYACLAAPEDNGAAEPWNLEREVFEARAPTPALALVLAVLRAKENEDG